MLPYSSLRAFNSVFSDAAVDAADRSKLRPTQARDYWTGRQFDKAARTKRVIRAEATRRAKQGVKVTLASKA